MLLILFPCKRDVTVSVIDYEYDFTDEFHLLGEEIL